MNCPQCGELVSSRLSGSGRHYALICSKCGIVGTIKNTQGQQIALNNSLRDSILKLSIEVNCRIEHGASSGGHLEFVQSQLSSILSHFK